MTSADTGHTEQTRSRGGRPPSHRGVAFDVGTGFATGQGELSRNRWDRPLMEAELDLVTELNANSVSVYGSDLDRLRDTARAAAERGLHIWLDPRLPDAPQDDVIDHLAEVARLAESLRGQGVDIDLTVGATHTILTPGIFPGEPYLERIANIFFAGDQRFGVRTPKTAEQWLTPQVTKDLTDSAPKLNEFLGRAAKVARGIFGGKLAYNAAPWEQADWGPFDFIGVMYFLMPSHMTAEQHLGEIARLQKWDKPILISAFGTATYRGAEEKGFFSWDIVDRGGETPRILDGHDRDETAQAAYYRRMLDIFERAGVYGVAPADLVHPTHPHSPDPRLDLDMASMCIVKIIREDFTDPDSPYTREKKAAFDAIADYYAQVGDRAGVAG